MLTNDVAHAVHPPTAHGRRYRDALGRANLLHAATAEEVELLESGIPVRIK
ncbi:MAG: bifunctional adenosylcobinamide kinase/adenosylcobinamide-phosphate guanylyltransferase [Gemmatimonadetes bacterium]|nr:bifunctional adenosylcobinamide kinase/adenosylcobinamide-phosphate guanylyltransferase [Gemmatimonadota bacterium]